MKRLRLKVRSRREVAEAVVEFELAAADGARLPGAGPGSHLDLTTPNGSRRSYSLTGGPSTGSEAYHIAVARDDDGRGGSVSMHEQALPGTILEGTDPTPAYAFHDNDDLLLIAGGIGITPLRWMWHRLAREKHSGAKRLVYLVRSRGAAAYYDELLASGASLHVSKDHGGRLDLWPLLHRPERTRIFCCGPSPLLEEVRSLTMHWRPSRLTLENFRLADTATSFDEAFSAIWEPTGELLHVREDQSLLEALEDRSLPVRGSCRAGTCGVCVLRRVAGEVDHRDEHLAAEDREQLLLPCVSRGRERIVVSPPGAAPSD